MPYDAEFKIYSSKMSFSGFDTLAKYNTKDGLIEAEVIKGHSITDVDGNVIGYDTGDRSLSMVSLGASPILSSGTMNMFVDVGTADQALNLVLNQDSQTSMGDTGAGYLFANAAIAMKDEHKAAATITFTGAASTDETITIIDSEGTSITYTAKGSADFGDNEFATVYETAAGSANSLGLAIEHANGHAGTIIVTNDGSGKLALVQKTSGAAGNTTITENLTNVTVSSFAGGSIPLRQMNLYTKGGMFDSNLSIFLKTLDPFYKISPTLNLEIAGDHLSLSLIHI